MQVIKYLHREKNPLGNDVAGTKPTHKENKTKNMVTQSGTPSEMWCVTAWSEVAVVVFGAVSPSNVLSMTALPVAAHANPAGAASATTRASAVLAAAPMANPARHPTVSVPCTPPDGCARACEFEREC